LADQLDNVLRQLAWQDLIATFFVAGQLSWRQLCLFMAAMGSSPPDLLLWARRLVTRSSLPLPPGLVLPKGQEVDALNRATE